MDDFLLNDHSNKSLATKNIWLKFSMMIFCKQVIFFIIVCFNSGGSRGRVRGVWNPLSDLMLVWDRNSYILTLFHRLIFLLKCTLHFATKLNSRDIKKQNTIAFGLLWLVTNQVISLMNGCQNLHSYTYIMTLTLMKSVQSQEEDVPRVHPLWVEFKYTARGQGITCNCDFWEGGVGEK